MPREEGGSDEFDATTLGPALAPLEAMPTRVGQSPSPRSPDDLERVHLGSRYLLGEKLGAGGMGVVVEAYDPRMRRELAIKRPHPNRDDGGRILTEARIQSALEHPAIVPVYEVGRDQDGRTYFTMRRLEGTSLAEVLRRGDDRESIVTTRWTVGRLLRAFVDVCMAVEYAHSRGFIHCDLKPGNILFGEFGEVYVLDWGTARRFREGHDPDAEPRSRARNAEGTPAYMAPEQFSGQQPLGPSADVFSLGAILFEILCGEPLHARKTSALHIQSEYEAGTCEASPIARGTRKEISPELDWLVQACLRVDPDERLSSARQLADGVQAFLDGDRDLELRRTIAATHVREAEELLESYEADPKHASVRAAAFAEAARALSYDPTHEVARDLVTRLLFESPAELPDEVVHAVHAQEARVATQQSGVVVLAYVAVLLMLPLFLAGGVRSVPAIAAIVVLTTVLLLNALHLARGHRPSVGRVVVRALLDALLVGLLGTLFGFFTLPPALAVMAALMHAGHPSARTPYLVPLCHAVAPLVGLGLELSGGLGHVDIGPDAIVIPAGAVGFHPLGTRVALWLYPPLLLVLASVVRTRAVVATRAEHLRHELQRWHLQKVVDVRRPSAGAEPPPLDL